MCTCVLQVSSRLAEFRELVKEVAVTACYTALLEAGYIPDYGKGENGLHTQTHTHLLTHWLDVVWCGLDYG